MTPGGILCEYIHTWRQKPRSHQYSTTRSNLQTSADGVVHTDHRLTAYELRHWKLQQRCVNRNQQAYSILHTRCVTSRVNTEADQRIHGRQQRSSVFMCIHVHYYSRGSSGCVDHSHIKHQTTKEVVMITDLTKNLHTTVEEKVPNIPRVPLPPPPKIMKP